MPAAAAPGLRARRFDAVLFDMDGTLVDSIASVERSWLRWCGEYGVDPRRLAGLHGVTARNVIADLLPEEQREEAFRRIEGIEVDDVDGITVLPGAEALLRALAAAGVPTAVVTSASTPLAEARLAATGLPHPPVVVTPTTSRAASGGPTRGCSVPAARRGPGRLPRRRGRRRRSPGGPGSGLRRPRRGGDDHGRRRVRGRGRPRRARPRRPARRRRSRRSVLGAHRGTSSA